MRLRGREGEGGDAGTGTVTSRYDSKEILCVGQVVLERGVRKSGVLGH